MNLREILYQHLLENQEITYPEVVAYAKKTKERLVTGLRFLQSDKGTGRIWEWRRYDVHGNLLKTGKAWFRKRLKKPIKRSVVFTNK
jgi:transcription initiation factor TFIIIB Brf1 subunit/transcription initiation factor TFIIB